MAFIREKEEIKTGFQEIEPWSSEIDLQTDFVMVYGLNESLESRMQQYRERGYKVHLMLGCAWGNYKEYLPLSQIPETGFPHTPNRSSNNVLLA